MSGDGEPAARMLRIAADAYGWSGPGLVDSMLTTVRYFQAVVAPGPSAQAELARLERNAEPFRARLPA